jgi:hypothetical protein
VISNLRSKPIEGHVTDSAGNILRNAQITIKQQTPNGSIIIDSIQSDDAGYFVSNPITNGVYDIYESGIKISRLIHNTGSQSVQCFQANRENYNPSIVGSFSDLIIDPSNINSYRVFIQIEPTNIDIFQFGNIFPLYGKDISTDPEINGADGINEIYYLAKFYKLSDKSRITVTRFDIEFFSPITSISSTYKRTRWTGVPAIKFYEDSKLVIPLDYYSIMINNPKIIVPTDNALSDKEIIFSVDNNNTYATLTDTVDDGRLTTLTNNLTLGDILKIRFKFGTTYPMWYGIVTNIDSSSSKKVITLEKWKSSRFISDIIDVSQTSTTYVNKIFAFDGMFSNMMDINEEVNQLFTITENIFAQDNAQELYNYIQQ